MYGANPITGEQLDRSSFGGSCNLGSLVLHNFINDPFKKEATFNWDKLKYAIGVGVNLLDNIIDINNYPDKIYENYQNSFRTIGMGITSLASAMSMLGIRYDSEQAVEFIDKLMDFISLHTYKASIELAKKKGAFPFLDKMKFINSGYLKKKAHNAEWAEVINDIERYGIRNAKMLSVAPTGTMSLVFGNNCSSGMEPIFSLGYDRKIRVGGQSEDNETIVELRDFSYDVWKKMDGGDYKDQSEVFVTALELSPDKKIRILSTIAYHVDMSVSNTLNIPEEYTLDQVKDVYIRSWESGIKGCTIFRPNKLRAGILITKKENAEKEEKVEKAELGRGYIMDCSDDLIIKKRKLMTGCGSLHVIAGFDPDTGELQETYFNKGSTGGCVSGDTEYFNGVEWKPISQYKEGEKVLQYNKDGTATLTAPINYIVNDNVKTLKHFKNENIDMMLSNDHRMYLYTNYSKYKLGIRKELHDEIVTVDDWIKNGKKERHMPTTFAFNGRGIPLTDEEIRVCVMVYADGHICNAESEYYSVVVSKERKKEQVRKLLEKCGIPCKEFNYESTPNYTTFKFYATPNLSSWLIDKQFTQKWYNTSPHQMKVIIEEIVRWDGSVGVGNREGEYFSSKKEEIDFIQFAFTTLGYRATISKNGKEGSYRVRPTKRSALNIKFAKIIEEKTLDNKSYCFTVPSSMLVLRYNDKIFVTGNCNNFMNGLSRSVSLLGRAGVDIFTIVDQLNSTGSCPSYSVRKATKKDTSPGACCPMAIGNALISMYNEVKDEIGYVEEKKLSGCVISPGSKNCAECEDPLADVVVKGSCPECGETIDFEGGCVICKSCGYTKCG